MEIKDSLFDNVLYGNGTKDDLINLIREGSLSISQQLKILSDGIRLAIHEASLDLTEEEISELEEIETYLNKANIAMYQQYKKATFMKKIPNVPRSLECCTNIKLDGDTLGQ